MSDMPTIEEIRAFSRVIEAEVSRLFDSPAAQRARWERDFNLALRVAVRMPLPMEDAQSEERLVARAARIADLMAAEKRKRQPRPDGEISQ